MAGENTTTPVTAHRFVVRAEDSGKRMDVLLAERIPEISRRRARRLLAAGSVSLDGRRTLVLSRRVAAGQEVLCHVQEFTSARPPALKAERILHEDRSLVAIDKPAGAPSHPTLARREGSALQLTEELLRRRAGEKIPLWPLHRLDTGTSGILVFARSQRAARAMSQNFARRQIHKRYIALVAGVPEPREGEIGARLLEAHFRTQVAPEGKEAVTRYRVLEAYPRAALVEIEPLTGRMHQIRVHLATIGHPVLGDTKYGKAAATRLFLHASRLELPHPEGGRLLVIESPLPAEFQAAIEELRSGAECVTSSGPS